MSSTGWRVIGKSVRGASHVRTNLPNQDAIGWLPPDGNGLPLVAAVSDGHGSSKSFRSDRGARMAIAAVMEELSQLFEGGEPDAARLATIRKLAKDRLPQLLVRRWVESVNADLEKEPLAVAELEALEKKEGAAARTKVETNPLLVYGATVLAVLVTRGFILYVQLGDGDIITVNERIEPSRPMAHDARLFANETTSLCSRDAEREVRVELHVLAEGAVPPALILVSTDGYANSFLDEKGFLKVSTDILEMICDDGIDQIEKDMESWLVDASKVGSGDDITVGLVCHTASLAACKREVERQKAAKAATPAAGPETLAAAAAATASAAAATASAAAATASAAAATANAAAAIASSPAKKTE